MVLFFGNYLGTFFAELCLLAAPNAEFDKGQGKNRLSLWLKWQIGKHSQRGTYLELIL
jgi:hypothetical protein